MLTLVIALLGLLGYLYWQLDSGHLSGKLQELLQEKLGTEVELKDCRLHIMEQELTLYGLNIKDHQQVDMFHVDTLEMDVKMLPLLHNQFLIDDLRLSGAHTHIYWLADSKQLNTQFVTDSLKTLMPKRDEQRERRKLVVDLRQCHISNTSVQYESSIISLEHVDFHPMRDSLTHLAVYKAHIHTDNHKPRRNVGHPHRGSFDAGHLDMDISFDATASYLTADSISLVVNTMTANDPASRLRLDDLTMQLQMAHQQCQVSDLKLTSRHTTVSVPHLTATLPSKVTGRQFVLAAPEVNVHALLSDIAYPFCKRLSHFSTPLDVTCGIDFQGHRFGIYHARVNSSDRQLRIQADGSVNFLGRTAVGKKKVDCRFTVHSMHATNSIKNRIIGHFKALPPSLTNMLTNIGNIGFHGNLRVYMKHTHITGLLGTEIGDFKTDFTYEKPGHRMKGEIASDSVSLSTLTGNKNLGKLAFNADFNLQLQKGKRLENGKKALPKGYLEGKAIEARYRRFHIKNIDFLIESDGENAKGGLASINRLIDVWADFSFQGADIKHTLRVKPHIRMHNLLENTFLKKVFKRRFRRHMREKEEAEKDSCNAT